MPLSGGAKLLAAPVAPIAYGRQLCLPSPTVEDTVGDRVRKARKRAKIRSQLELAERADVTRGYIADLESNQVKGPRDPDLLRKVAAALGVSFEWLAAPTGWTSEKQTASPADLVIGGRAFHGLTEADLEVVEQVAARLAERNRLGDKS